MTGAGDLAGMLERQAELCRDSSPLMHALLTGAAQDLRTGVVVAEVLAGARADGEGSVPGLRLAAALHRLVLSRRAPRLALLYPTVGGTLDLDALWPTARTALTEHAEQVARWVGATAVQTNEVGRSAPLWGGLQVAAQQVGGPGAGGLGVRLLEVGASAGLNLRPDLLGLAVGARVLGDAAAPLVLDPGWTGVPRADLDRPLRVVHRAGCDVDPVDVGTADGREHLGSFVWADDTVRWERLRGALALAATAPVAVQALSAPDFLDRELARPHAGALTVVWHSVVRQYASAPDRDRARAVLADAAARASADAPLALLGYEPARGAGGGVRFELALQVWAGRDTGPQVLGHGSGHGIPFTWA